MLRKAALVLVLSRDGGGGGDAARELVSPVMTRGFCPVYRIKQQTNQVATMELTSYAAATVAASDTDVEFSSELLQTALAGETYGVVVQGARSTKLAADFH